ncbi:MAG: methyltransferase domain-containing protein [Myxococcales bacterium]|nr:methyltransferase domain-containing protein [Myxococcales bacterium]
MSRFPEITRDHLGLLACPACRGPLGHAGEALVCGGCAARWPIRGGLARLYREAEVRPRDRLMRLFYDGLPSLHDPAVRLLLPVIQGVSEAETRRPIIDALALDDLPTDRPVRVLETGIGCGANVGLVHDALPPGVTVDYWGLDLSVGMLRKLPGRLRGRPLPTVVQADAHDLPFATGAFDRVFHVGGLGGFGDPGRALAEMARVARPGTPVVVVDEQLDPGFRAGLVRRALFRAVTFYDRHPHAPVDALPPGATAVHSGQASPCFYLLRFEMGEQP